MNELGHPLSRVVLLLDPGSAFDVSVDLYGSTELLIELASAVPGEYLSGLLSTRIGPSLGGGAVGAFLTTLIIGAILIAVVPDYAQSTMTSMAREPVGSFLYGLLALLALLVVTVALILTLIGIVVAIPLVLFTGLVWGVGAAIGYLAIADRLIGHENGWTTPLLIASIINGGLTLTGVGGLVSFAVGATGFGAVLRGFLG
ncbi:MAG: hypothetical protein ABEH88_01060 [Halobacteriales archaeon]